MKIELIEAERDEDAPFRYGGHLHDPVLTAYPIPHELDSMAYVGTPVPPKHRAAARRMLEADLVPDSIGRPGSPAIGIAHNPPLAHVLRLLINEHDRIDRLNAEIAKLTAKVKKVKRKAKA